MMLRAVSISCLIKIVYCGLTYNQDVDYKDESMVKKLVDQVEHEYVDPIEHTGGYKADWADLDSRPLPDWYDKAKIGIFVHWGVYSVPGINSEWFWYRWSQGNEDCLNLMNKYYPPGFTYQEFAPMFKAEYFDPVSMANLFAMSGAKYVVLTTKHHDGYALFPSRRSFSWNAVDVGPHRDLAGELAGAVRNLGMKFGVYYSLYEWNNPLYIADRQNSFATQTYVNEKVWPDLMQLINDYTPSMLWSDGEWEANSSYWKSTEFLAWLYNDSPVRDEIVTNDRWGREMRCHHGDFYNCADRFNPGKLLLHKWENAFTLDRGSWGYNRRMTLSTVMTIRQVISEVISTISCGGNALINVGPTKEGIIPPIFQERLLALGQWLRINGEAIYNSNPWSSQNDTFNGGVWYTSGLRPISKLYPGSGSPQNFTMMHTVYASFLDWPESNILMLEDVTSLLENDFEIEMLGNEGTVLDWRKISNNRTAILLPLLENVQSKHAWTLRFKPILR